MSIPLGNLTVNPSFESSTTGWTTSNASLARVQDSNAPNGSYVARITKSGLLASSYTLDDSPATVSSSHAGRAYTAEAWVKGSSSSQDEIELTVRETNSGGSTVGSKTVHGSLNSTIYSSLSAAYTAAGTGNRIEVLVRRSSGLLSSESFYVDAVTLTRSAPAAPVLSSTDPASGSNDNTPLIKGSAEAGSTVKLYVAAGCTGVPVASGSASALSSPGLTVPVLDNVTTTFRATATDSTGEVSPCSGPISYAEVSAAGSTLATDLASTADPLPFWGSIDCDLDSNPPQSSGPSLVSSGGDPAAQGNGAQQGNTSFRRLTTFDGDDFWGERCELGMNDHRYGTTVFYEEGDHLLTYVSLRLPGNFPLSTDKWQGGLQMKQTQPSNNGGGTPVISLGAYQNQWILFHSDAGFTSDDQAIWSTPAQLNVWTRLRFDVVFSADSDQGSLQLSIDLNADGDFSDSGERSPTFETNTLKEETSGDDTDGYSTGDALPSHLRAGIYHHKDIPCPAPSGCSIDLDNVQVIRP